MHDRSDPPSPSRLERYVIASEHLATYAHHLDLGALDRLTELFAADAHLDLVNFVPGSGERVALDGRDAIRSFYAPFVKEPGSVRGGHHVSNVITAPGPAGGIEVSAYFLTAAVHVTWGQGGHYRAALVQDGDRWVFQRLAVTSWVAIDDATRRDVGLDALDRDLHPLPLVRHAG